MTISPRQQFLLLDKTNVLVPFALAIDSYPMRTAITHSLAQMATDGASSEQLKGANLFIDALTSLVSEKEMLSMPVHSLTSDLGGQQIPAQQPTSQPKEEKKKK